MTIPIAARDTSFSIPIFSMMLLENTRDGVPFRGYHRVRGARLRLKRNRSMRVALSSLIETMTTSAVWMRKS
jgi:hypothetical protein